ncbi:MAG: hypothetical protein H6Q16_1234 [Bacteroidetes bacterium]|nr:hypothetical protein [Bacteroidota bacterium]
MADFIICPEVILEANKSKKYWSKLLYPFTDDENRNRVVYNDEILSMYDKIEGYHYESWIDLLIVNKKIIKITKTDESNKCIFISTCKKSYDKKLIVCEKNDCTEKDKCHECDLDEIDLINKDEAIDIIKPSNCTINIFGNKNNVTTGDSSPINN